MFASPSARPSLISLSSRSPGTSAAITRDPARTSSVLTRWTGSTPSAAHTSSTRVCPGVSTRSGASSAGCVGRSTAPGSARSSLAAYPHASHWKIWLSPESASTTNSWFTSPPIAPASASTITASSPQRSRMRRYASAMRS